MRGADTKQASMITLVSPESMVPADHPLRKIKALVEPALKTLSSTFDQMYSKVGRPSVPPERLLKAQLLMAFFTIRSERQLCEQLRYNFLYRWFLDMNMTDDVFDPTVFTQNRKRLMEHDVAVKFFAEIVDLARGHRLLSDDHFTVDGTLIEAWASIKSFKRKDDPTDGDPPTNDPGSTTGTYRGEKLHNDSHASTTDPEAKLAKKSDGAPAKLSFSQHVLMDNREGLILDVRMDLAGNRVERDVALEMLDDNHRKYRATLGADANYDTAEFVAECRDRRITPHVAQNQRRGGGSAIDGKTTRHPGWVTSQRRRKRVEEIFGWFKTVGNFRRTRFKGLIRNQLASYLLGTAYNLIRLTKLLPVAAMA